MSEKLFINIYYVYVSCPFFLHRIRLCLFYYPCTMKDCVFTTPHTLYSAASTLYERRQQNVEPYTNQPSPHLRSVIHFVITLPTSPSSCTPILLMKSLFRMYTAFDIYVPFRGNTGCALLFAIERNEPHIFFRVLSSGSYLLFYPFFSSKTHLCIEVLEHYDCYRVKKSIPADDV